MALNYLEAGLFYHPPIEVKGGGGKRRKNRYPKTNGEPKGKQLELDRRRLMKRTPSSGKKPQRKH